MTATLTTSDAHWSRHPVPAQLEAHGRAKERRARLDAMVAMARGPLVLPPPPAPKPEPGPVEEAPLVYDPLSAQFAAAHEMLRRLSGEESIPIRHIQRVVAAHYGVTVADIVSARRTGSIMRPRMVAVYLSRVMTAKSFPEIGHRFGDRDHTTMLHSCKKITALIAADAEFAAEVEGLRREIGGAP